MPGSAIRTVGDILRVNAFTLPNEPALTCADITLNYRELNSHVNRVAHALLAAGVEPNDRIAVLAKNSLPYFSLYFAAAKIGALLVPLNYWNRSAQHADVLGDVEAKMIFVEPEYTETMQSAVEHLPSRPSVILLPPWGETASPGSPWDTFLDRADSTDEPQIHVSPDAGHMIMYTSGTTGRAKGAVLSHERTVSDGFSMAAVLGIRQSDVYGNWFTPFHVSNWDQQKYFLIMGAHVVLYAQFDAGLVIEGIQRHRQTVMLTMTIMIQQVMDHPDFAAADLSSLRLMFFGAYDPSGIMMRAADTFGAHRGEIEMVHVYGITEGGSIVTACPADRVFEKWGSVGRAIPGNELRLDDEGREVGVGEPGEILVRGPIMSGYWRREKETAEALAGGWLHTGDIGVADDEGFIRIVDRKKDMIRSGGQNVYSKEVEDCLVQHEDVRSAAVIGLPDPTHEEQVCAVVVPTGPHVDRERLPERLMVFVRQRLAGYNTPRRVIVVDELPTNTQGKTRKSVLRESYGSMFDVRGTPTGEVRVP